MNTHLGMMCLFAACVAAVFAALLRAASREQVRLAVRVFGGLVLGAYALGWLMYGVFH